MLAPRKTLWSTPDEVIEKAIQWSTEIHVDGEVICDIGCGDGRVILLWAQAYSSRALLSSDPPRFIGIEIDQDRINEAKTALGEAYCSGRVDRRISIDFLCKNAMEAAECLQDVTIFFLYLIPRGLRIILPIIYETALRDRHVISYMSPLPNESAIRRECVPVKHQPGASWPLYLYRVKRKVLHSDT